MKSGDTFSVKIINANGPIDNKDTAISIGVSDQYDSQNHSLYQHGWVVHGTGVKYLKKSWELYGE